MPRSLPRAPQGGWGVERTVQVCFQLSGGDELCGQVHDINTSHSSSRPLPDGGAISCLNFGIQACIIKFLTILDFIEQNTQSLFINMDLREFVE